MRWAFWGGLLVGISLVLAGNAVGSLTLVGTGAVIECVAVGVWLARGMPPVH